MSLGKSFNQLFKQRTLESTLPVKIKPSIQMKPKSKLPILSDCSPCCKLCSQENRACTCTVFPCEFNPIFDMWYFCPSLENPFSVIGTTVRISRTKRGSIQYVPTSKKKKPIIQYISVAKPRSKDPVIQVATFHLCHLPSIKTPRLYLSTSDPNLILSLPIRDFATPKTMKLLRALNELCPLFGCPNSN
ncbi:hypothetical protein IC620_16755 [Hazenella sp. IB182357]|uniref:Uncharacterized protein n=1 Tax=Polycladospora coralii TaxID=2771432 RepID=A0A926NCZ7_9BACL|nr:hypothetical protein [Polycladospora coralii]MBD1373992.1 hypothetical protein [Polycladospora coralii]MBS7531875.1 hypothetical protein [Polycladospora coralii]